MDHISAPLELDGLAKKEVEEKDIEEDLLRSSEIEEEEEEEEKEKEEDEDVYKDLLLHPQVGSWIKDDGTGATVHGIQVVHVPLSTNSKRIEFDLCPICIKPWTPDDKTHQISSLPCGHMFGLSCLKNWIEDRPSDKCPKCYQNFSLESVIPLYEPRLCIPAPASLKVCIRCFSFSKIGFTTFKHYEQKLRTNALNNRSDVLKQRADALGRQNDAMERRTKLLNRMADLEKRADVLERHNDAMKQHTQLVNRMTDEEEWAEASEQQADAQKRAEVFRRKACALGQSADEYQRKADAFGQHAKALGQQAKSLRQLVDSYLACRDFYIQSYKEFYQLSGSLSLTDFCQCPQCHQNFSLQSVTHLYAPHLCIQVAVAQKVDHISLFELDEAEKEVAEMELDLDDDDDDDEDFEKVEDLMLPLVSKWDSPNNGPPIHGLEVPVMKDDEFILDSMYRNDIDIDIDIDDDDDPPLPPHVFDPLPPPPAPVCSICFRHWTPIHRFCCLPCGHIFGFHCIHQWLQTNLRGTCPQCKALCSLKDVRTLNATRLCIPTADKGVADPEISTRRFSFTRQGLIKFRMLESGRRNFALKKRSDAKKRLAGVVGRKNDLMKRRTDLLDRRASVLNRAKALEKKGGSLRLQADALRLRADALGRWADEYLRRAKACEERAKALGQRARAYNQRVKAFEARLFFFRQSYENYHSNS